MEQTIKCEEHTPIILNTEHIDDQLLEKVKDIQETNEKETISDEKSNSNQKKQKRSKSSCRRDFLLNSNKHVGPNRCIGKDFVPRTTRLFGTLE